jgi:hypothetical protein
MPERLALLPDAAVLLRARALLGQPVIRPLLTRLMPFQLKLELGVDAATSWSPEQNANLQNHQ